MKKTPLVLMFSFAALFVLSGCASTRQAKIDDLNSRVNSLEDTLRRKDDEIAGLRNEADRLAREAAEKDKTIRALSPAPKLATITNDAMGIIRVDATVENVQTALKGAGLYDGNIDGKLGPKTISAIAAFQKENGLREDSIVGRQTWDKLKVFLK